MPQTYTPAWHTSQDTQERAWLDAWFRGLINPDTLQPHPVDVVLVPVLATAGSPR